MMASAYSSAGGDQLADLASRRVDSSLHEASRRVCRAMLILAPLRDSQDPEMRAAYENIHDVMGDLASIHHWSTLATMAPVQRQTVVRD
jgi:hypothetical protein